MILGARGARQRSILALADQVLSSLTNFDVSFLLAKLSTATPGLCSSEGPAFSAQLRKQ